VAEYTNRYVLPGRCPADDLLDEARGAESPAHILRYLHDIRLPDDNPKEHR
jgi:hypothetical protein